MVIDVEANPEITSNAIADAAAVDPHAVDAIPVEPRSPRTRYDKRWLPSRASTSTGP